MDETEIKHVVEAALLAAGRPLTLDRLLELFTKKGGEPDRAAIRRALDALAADYQARGIEIKEVASGFRVQVKRSMSDWLSPLWEERAPRYTRALLETLALVAYRQPITRAEIEEVRGVVVSTNIVRTLLERGWIRVVGHRDVPGKPAMFGTTKEFLDYFGLKRLEDLPPLAEIKDSFPEVSPQADLIESLDTGPHLTIVGDEDTEAAVEPAATEQAEPAGEGQAETAPIEAEAESSAAPQADAAASAETVANDGELTEPSAADDDEGVGLADDEGMGLADDEVAAIASDESTQAVSEDESTQAVSEDTTQAAFAEALIPETSVEALAETSAEASADTYAEDEAASAPEVSAPVEMPVHVAAAVETAINEALAGDSADDNADDGVVDEVDGRDESNVDDDPDSDAEREALHAKTAD